MENGGSCAPMQSSLAALLVLGLWIPAGLDTAILHSAAVIG